MPVLVVGTGRCGTSAVASILIDLGVFMGHAFVAANKSNVAGHWEDLDFRNLNAWRLEERIDPASWRKGVEFLASNRDGLWGFKDPRSAHFIDEYIEILSPRFIRCRRDMSDIVASMCRWYDWPEEKALELASFRERMLNHHLQGQMVLDVDVESQDAQTIGDFVYGRYDANQGHSTPCQQRQLAACGSEWQANSLPIVPGVASGYFAGSQTE
jgi:hypothetical protein